MGKQGGKKKTKKDKSEQEQAHRDEVWTKQHEERGVEIKEVGPLGLPLVPFPLGSEGSGSPAHVKVGKFDDESAKRRWELRGIWSGDVLWKINGECVSSCDEVRGWGIGFMSGAVHAPLRYAAGGSAS